MKQITAYESSDGLIHRTSVACKEHELSISAMEYFRGDSIDDLDDLTRFVEQHTEYVAYLVAKCAAVPDNPDEITMPHTIKIF
jgi:hypothetical protein